MGLKELAKTGRPDLESYRNCRAINEAIAVHLQEQGIDCKIVEGNLTKYGLRGTGPEHAFVVIHEIKYEKWIVDGAIGQFSDENKQDGLTHFSIGSDKDLPEIAVLAPQDPLYEHYQW